MTVYARWNAVYYTVSFNANGHGTAPASIQVQGGTAIGTLPEGPEATGWTFVGWYTESTDGTQVTESTIVNSDMTVYAQWSDVNCTVTFNANGHGTAPSPVVVRAGETITLPTVPTAEHWSFVGWYTKNGTATGNWGEDFDENTIVNSSMTVYARWNPVYYTVTYSANGHGTAPAAVQVQGGTAIGTLPEGPEEIGWNFQGWYTASTGGTQVTESTVITGNTTVYAQWSDVNCIVTFNANGHGTAPSPVTVRAGQTITLPTAPTAEHWTFIGWYTKNGTATGNWGEDFDETTIVNSSMTVYARWNPVYYTVTYSANGHGTAPAAVQVQGGTAIGTLPEGPEEIGWNFQGWYTASTGGTQVTESTVITGNTTVYAQWSDVNCIVTFDTNSHGTAPSPITVRAGETITLPTAPTTEHWTFVGWYTKNGMATGNWGDEFDENTVVNSSMTVYARWNAVYYTVSFNANGHGTAPSNIQIQGGTAIGTLPEGPEATGWNFQGWYTASTGGSQVTESTLVTENMTIYAQWSDVNCTVTFNANGHGVAPSPITVREGQTVTLPTAPTAEHWTFVGWYTKNGTATGNWGDDFDETTVVTKSMTVYARWNPVYYTVTYNANGHGTTPAAVQVQGGTAIGTLPEGAEVTGWNFQGWYTASTGGSQVTESTIVTENMTVYAQWSDVNCTVTFNANGHGAAPAAITVREGDTITLPTPPTADHWIFVGWYTKNGTLTANWGDEFDENTPVTKSITVYARWNPVYYTVTFSPNGHGTAPNPSTRQVQGGTVIGALPEGPEEIGWDFVGWYTEDVGGTQVTETTIVNNDMTVYAQWADVTYTITFDENGHGTAPEPIQVQEGRTTILPEIEAAHWYFTGWYTKNGSVTGNWGDEFTNSTIVNNDIKLYARWEAKYYTVKFDTNGNGVAPEDIVVQGGHTITLPADPEATGWIFKGWYTENGVVSGNWRSEFTDSTPVEDNMTVYAKWEAINCVVTFDNNGLGTTPASIAVQGGHTITLPAAPTEVHWSFAGWYTNNGVNTGDWGTEFTSSTVVTNSITVYAKWEPIYYTITYNSNSYGTQPKPISVRSGRVVILPDPLIEANWDFKGWYTKNGIYSGDWGDEFTGSTVVMRDMTVYAKWEEDTSSVTFSQTDTSGANAPELYQGLYPIKYAANGDIIFTDASDAEWYNYSDGKWANAVTLDGSGKMNVENITGYYVWVPRYAYLIRAKYNSADTGRIDIRFLNGTTNTDDYGVTYRTLASASDTSAKWEELKEISYVGDRQMEYLVHPAFKFDDELAGIWVAKYEASEGTGNTDDMIESVPNVMVWSELDVNSCFEKTQEMTDTNNIYGFDGNVDTHLVKATEYGAAVYLDESIYEAEEQYAIRGLDTTKEYIAGYLVGTANIGGSNAKYKDIYYIDASGNIVDVKGSAYLETSDGKNAWHGQEIEGNGLENSAGIIVKGNEYGAIPSDGDAERDIGFRVAITRVIQLETED